MAGNDAVFGAGMYVDSSQVTFNGKIIEQYRHEFRRWNLRNEQYDHDDTNLRWVD